MALYKRTFRIEVDYWSEDRSSFDTMKTIAINSAQELFGAGLLASGGASKHPNVRIFVESSSEGVTEFDRDGEEV